MNRTKMMVMTLAAFVTVTFAAAQADVIKLQTTPIGNNTVDWSSVGLPVGTQLHGFLGFSAAGDTATATVAGANANRGRLIQEGTNWIGDFKAGEWGIWTQSHGPLTVSFGNSYNLVGAYFQPDFFGTFTVVLQAYSGSTLLGTVSETGTSTTTAGSALFIGALDTTAPNITKVVLNLGTPAATNTNFAIATMFLGVPEPGTLVLMGTGLLGLAGLVRRRATC